MNNDGSILKDDKGGVLGGVVAIILILLFIIFVCFIDVVTCPVCRGFPLVKYACGTCGGDGMVSILQYILLGMG